MKDLEMVSKSGEKYKITAEEIGEVLINLETTREILGHTSIKSTLRYVHGMEDIPEFAFVRDIFLRDSR